MKLRVLLADDHALFRDGMRYVLQQLSDQVDIICAGNFTETLRLAEVNPGLDLALIDLNMPGSDGVASIRIFHHHFPEIPLVVISGSDQRSEIEWVMEYGAMGFISKSSSHLVLSGLAALLPTAACIDKFAVVDFCPLHQKCPDSGPRGLLDANVMNMEIRNLPSKNGTMDLRAQQG